MKIDWNELKDAFTFSSDEAHWYLDLETGRTVFVSEFDPGADDATFEDMEDDRYVPIEAPSSGERYEWMVEFVEGVEDEALAEKLWIALDGKGAFRRFKDVLLGCPDYRKAWFEFEDAKVNAAVSDWVKSSNIEADNPPPWEQEERSRWQHAEE